jgi:hypothetical protein
MINLVPRFTVENSGTNLRCLQPDTYFVVSCTLKGECGRE